ncbi:15865_t:CDS:2, partial [Acaulospora morrowiae]
SSLLKSIRTSYNIFLLSKDSKNQTIAQGTLTQMIHHVFSRINISSEPKFELHAVTRKKKSRDHQDNASTIIVNEKSDDANLEHDPDLGARENGDEFDVQYGEGQNSRKGSLDEESVFAENCQIPVKSEGTDESLGEEGVLAENDLSLEGGANGDVSPGNVSTPIKLEGEHALEFGQWNDAQRVDDEVTKAVEAFKNPESVPAEEKVTLGSLENRQSFEAEQSDDCTDKEELFIKDAFLVFRSLCKLSMKTVSTTDLKSHSMRSKLLSLHLILTILSSHTNVFLSPNVLITSSTTHERTLFVQAIKQYLCLSLNRNAVSPVPQVFEISLEIFWKCMSKLRSHLKKEIEVFINEIFLPIMELRSSSMKQKYALMNILARICSDPQTLVEIYLNYDCDREALDNTYER